MAILAPSVEALLVVKGDSGMVVDSNEEEPKEEDGKPFGEKDWLVQSKQEHHHFATVGISPKNAICFIPFSSLVDEIVLPPPERIV